MRDYELMYILRPDLDDEEQVEAMSRVQELIEGHGGRVLKQTPWGKRRLAYTIDHIREGHYVLCDAQLETQQIPAIEASLGISEAVFRHLIVRKPRPELLIRRPAKVRRDSGSDHAQGAPEVSPATAEPEISIEGSAN